MFRISIISDRGTLYAIGALSKMFDITPDTLRYYGEIGLLKPAHISQETGYRYYSTDQAATLARIMEMKHFGFSLNEIKDILKQGEAALADIYQNRYWALEQEKKKLQETIDRLSVKIKQRQEKSIMGKKILLVDDAPFMRSTLRDLFSREGYEVVGEACDGLEAVELYKSLKPDIVILDIVMPNMDGTSALEKIMAFEEHAHVVMCSAMGQARVVAQALILGAKDFIVKPFQGETLLDKARKSFDKGKPFNQEILQQICDVCAENTENISQLEVEKIMQTARLENNDQEVATLINFLKERSPAEQQGFDPSIEQTAQIYARLDKLERGVEDIKEMLRTLTKQ